MEILTIIIFIASLVIANIIVTKVQRLYMKIMDIDAMFFSGKKKAIAVLIIGFLIAGIAYKLFGIGNA